MIPRFSRNVASFALVACMTCWLPAEVFGQSNDPAYPVPSAYWPVDFRPGLPAQQFPARRDSTTWASLSVPGYQSGHELFVGVATVPGVLFAGYNAGFHVWDISAGNEELAGPEPITYRDGWMGDFLSFPDFSEVDLLGNAVTAYQDGSTAYFAYAARAAAGVSIWKLNTTPPITSGDLTQLYQDTIVSSKSVRFEKIGSTLYLFAAVTGNPNGIVVYDVTRAQAIGSCVDTGTHTCSNVYLGNLGTTTLGNYVDVLPLPSGKLMVSASLGTSGGMVLMEVTSPGVVTQRFSGLAARSHGTALFEKSGNTYLAVVEQVLGIGGAVKIYDIDACIGSNCSLGAPVATSRSFSFRGVLQQLTYSESGGKPYLHYGIKSNSMSGAAQDFLVDISNVGGTNVLNYVGDSGATFLDNCSNQQVGYWGWYYPLNCDGLSEFSPIQGQFEGDYFYRAGWTILDVHFRGAGGADPSITTTADTAPPHWMDEPLDFSAVRNNCAGGGTWNWSHGDSLSAGVVNNGETAVITYALCATTDCPDRFADVEAGHSACSGADSTTASITLVEPRAQIRSLDISPVANPQTYPICTQLGFSTVLEGRDDPFTYSWEIRDVLTDELMASGTSATLAWDTSDVIVEPPDNIFADGFESGDISQWDPPSPELQEPSTGLSSVYGRLLALIQEGAGFRDFNINLTVTNRGGSWVTQDSEFFTLTELGALGLDDPPITAVDLGGGRFEFTAESSNATEWRWEFEDPQNGTEACTLFSGSCQVFESDSANSVVIFQWAPPNVPGDYKVGVTIDNCTAPGTVGDSILQTVTEITLPEPLEMTDFEIHVDSINIGGDTSRPCKWNPLFGEMKCKRNVAIEFVATATGDPSHIGFDWEGDGSFEVSVPVAGPFQHSYSSLGIRNPEAQAELGASSSDPMGLTFGTTAIDLEIVDSF